MLPSSRQERMHPTTPFVLRITTHQGAAVRPFRTAAEAYDGAASVRRTIAEVGAALQVEDVSSGAVLGEWRFDEGGWLLNAGAAPSPAHAR